jgi:hypothetical protein
MAAARTTAGIPWAGLAAGPAAWAVATQLNYALVPWACSRGAAWLLIPALALLLAFAAVGGGLLSLRARQGTAGGGGGGQPRHFLAMIGALAAALFALLILLQGAAGLVFSGCEW